MFSLVLDEAAQNAMLSNGFTIFAWTNRGKYLLYKQADQISVEFWTLKTLC